MQPNELRASRNILLRQLAPADQALLEPHLEIVPVACGAVVIRPADLLDALYFPDTALLALEEGVNGSRRMEIGVVGCEGMLGWPLLLGSDRSPYAATVQMRAGTVLRLAREPLHGACRASRTLATRLLQFVDTIILQMSQAIASHLQDTLERRLARFLLMRHDRVSGDVLLLFHDSVAASLHVRRASVTDRLHILEGERLIRCRRGRVTIRDRPALEAFAGDSYGVAEAQYRALIAPFGKSPPMAVAA
jgi:CRP-like cAMP-binding protein